MNIRQIQADLEMARKLKATLENQKLILDVLTMAAQNVWNESEVDDQCRRLSREVSREAVKTVQQWADLADRVDRQASIARVADSETQPDDLPF